MVFYNLQSTSTPLAPSLVPNFVTICLIIIIYTLDLFVDPINLCVKFGEDIGDDGYAIVRFLACTILSQCRQSFPFSNWTMYLAHPVCVKFGDGSCNGCWVVIRIYVRYIMQSYSPGKNNWHLFIMQGWFFLSFDLFLHICDCYFCIPLCHIHL